MAKSPQSSATICSASTGSSSSTRSTCILSSYYYSITTVVYAQSTFVCPTEINAFNDRLNDFKAAGCEVLGASVDSEYAHLAWTRLPRNEGGLGPTHLPLLADTTHALAKAFGVHLDEAGVALRGLFIMDPKAIVRHATVNDLGIGRSVDETLRVLQAIQFTDKHGEVCPAGWQQGSPTIKPNPEESRIYFARLSAAASQ